MAHSDFVNRGQHLVAAGQFQEAVKVCRLGLLGQPAVAEGRVVLGRALSGLHRYDEVIAEMRVALDLDPTMIDAHVLKAEALLRTGESHAAIEALQRARRLAPSDLRIKELLDEAEDGAGTRAGSSREDTVTRPAARVDTGVPESVEETTSDAIELDPEVEGVEVRDDFHEVAAPPGAQGSRAAVGNSPISPSTPATMALPAAMAVGGTRRGSPTKPPPGAQVLPAKTEAKSSFPATLALPIASGPAPLPRGGASLGKGGMNDHPGLVGAPRTLIGMASDAAPQSRQHLAGSVLPAMPPHAEPPMSPDQHQAAVDVARLFAGSAPSQPAHPGSIGARPAAQSLNTTMAGLGGASAAPAVASAAPPAITQARPRFRLAVWALTAVVLIGAGLVAGFQIRAVRLDKQIKAAQERVREVTKSDTWAGWTAAAESLGAVADAAATDENRAAFARARSLIAFEFGDGQPEAERLAQSLAGAGGIDGKMAATYVALARGDASAAKQFASAAVAQSGADPAAMYVASQAALIGGDFAGAVALGKAAVSKDPRPQYALGLARVHAAGSAWSDALNAVQRVLASEPNHPGAVLERGLLLAASGRIAPSGAPGKEIRTQVEKLLAEPRALSPAQVGFGNLVLARIDFARNDIAAARKDVQSAASVGLDNMRFAEQAVETLYALGELGVAQKAAASALASWPASKRVRMAVAEIALAQGRANDALQVSGQADLAAFPRARALHGHARLAMGDLSGARKDFEAALKASPQLETALVGRVWLDIVANQAPGDAAKEIAERVASGAAVPAVSIAHAAVLRSGGELAQRDQARQILEAVIAGPPGPELALAQLELARVYRDSGDLEGARKAYGDAGARGSFEARLEKGLLAIEDRDPKGGASVLNLLLKDSGASPPVALVVDVARARSLSGDHTGAAQLIEKAAKRPGVLEWKLNRERGRLALRRGDVQAATTALAAALNDCKGDPETFLLAADAAGVSAASEFADTVEKLRRERLDGLPEALIVSGKLLLAAGNRAKAAKAYEAARDALRTVHASPRRVAQANLGLAVIAYSMRKDQEALALLNLVINDDPSIYDAYLFKADIVRDKAQAIEQARAAIRYNPDYPRAYVVLGKAAASVGDRATVADAVAKLKIIAPGSQELAQLAALAQ